jgi:hypothetical protein
VTNSVALTRRDRPPGFAFVRRCAGVCEPGRRNWEWLSADFFRGVCAFEPWLEAVCAHCRCVEAGEEDVGAAAQVGGRAHRAVAWTPQPRSGGSLDAGCVGRGAAVAGRVEHDARLRRRVPSDELGVDGLRHLLDPDVSGDDGGVGESFTREALPGRQFGWPVVDDVAMEHRNIDHVAVTPRAVLAIETKFVGAGRQWATDRYREASMDDARLSARSGRYVLLCRGVKDVPVEAVLMVWGPGAGQLENDWELVDGVHVVRGLAAEDE